MAYSVLQSVLGTVAASGSCTATYTSNLTAGSKLIALVSIDSNTTTVPTSVKDGALNAFTSVASVAYPSAQGGLSVWVLDTPSGDAGTKPTITATNGTNFGCVAVIAEVSGLAAGTSASVDGTFGHNTGTASPATNGAYSDSAANEFLLAVTGDAGYTSTYTLSGYTTLKQTAANSSAQLAAGFANSTGGTEAFSWAISSASTWGSLLLAFKLASGAAAAPPPPPPPAIPPGRRSPMAFWSVPVLVAPFPPAAPLPPFTAPPAIPPGRRSPMAFPWHPQPAASPVTVTDADSCLGTDAGEGITVTSPGDSCQGSDGSEAIAAASSDACLGTDAGEGISVLGQAVPLPYPRPPLPPGRRSPMAFPWLPVPQPAVAAFVFDADSCHGSDAGELVSLSSPDSSTGADGTERIGVTSSDASTGADGTERIGLSSADSSTEADGGEVVQPESSDASSGSDAGELVSLSDSDSGTSAESGFIGLSSADSSTEADGGEGITSNAVVLPPVPPMRPPGRRSPLAFPAVLVPVPPAGLPVVTDSDHCQGIDSGFSDFSDSDGCTGTEASGFGSLPASDSDSCSAAERELTAWPHDADGCSGLDSPGGWYTVASSATDSDACHSSDASATSSYAPSDSDACAGTEGQVIDVYTYQPLFRWTGGQFELRYRDHVVWRGARPDRRAYELGRALDAGLVGVVADHDGCRASEDEEVPPQVTLVAARAITVLLSVTPRTSP